MTYHAATPLDTFVPPHGWRVYDRCPAPNGSDALHLVRDDQPRTDAEAIVLWFDAGVEEYTYTVHDTDAEIVGQTLTWGEALAIYDREVAPVPAASDIAVVGDVAVCRSVLDDAVCKAVSLLDDALTRHTMMTRAHLHDLVHDHLASMLELDEAEMAQLGEADADALAAAITEGAWRRLRSTHGSASVSRRAEG